MRIPMTLVAAALLAALAACAPAPGAMRPAVSLPPDAVQGAGDPVRSALATGGTAFATPRRLANQPAAAARAIAEMEYLAAALAGNPRFPGQAPNLGPQLAAGRAEWRDVLGIPAEAPPQAVINGLFAAGRALDAGQPEAAASALAPPVFSRGGAATLAVLANLPALPRTNAAGVSAAALLQRGDGQGPGRR